jgi:hypothetical protein
MEDIHERAVVRLLEPCRLEARGGKLPVPGATPLDTARHGLRMYRVRDLGWCESCERRIGSKDSHCGILGAPEWRGQEYDAEAGTFAEVVAVSDEIPGIRMVRIQVPCNDVGGYHPHLLDGWIDAKYVEVASEHYPFRLAPELVDD